MLEDDEDLSEDEMNKAKSAFDGDLLPSDWQLPEDTTGVFDWIFCGTIKKPYPCN